MSGTNTVVETPVVVSEPKRLPGEPGLWVFLFGDMVVFGIFFVYFLVERGKAPEVFESSREALDLTIGLTNTMILLTSSLLVVIGLQGVRTGRFTNASKMFALAMGCGVLFAIFKAIEYIHMVTSDHGPGVNAYYQWFFILTGTHLFHVFIGIGALSLVLKRARRKIEPTGSDRMFYEGCTCYWHLVDLLWMVLFPLVYLVA
ncbi:UNVERIFIED_CONTAM: nitric oxide reductase NorE protein [Williamsia faeni]